nr:protein kinase [Nocardia nova]
MPASAWSLFANPGSLRCACLRSVCRRHSPPQQGFRPRRPSAPTLRPTKNPCVVGIRWPSSRSSHVRPGCQGEPANGVWCMSEDDPFRTSPDVPVPVIGELDAAGFEAAEEIGRGGFGVVYRCAQADLDRTVAVKVVTAELDADNRARFFREQRAMGRLTSHPNIATMLQTGTTESGRPYLVMPYYSAGSLGARIRSQGPLPLDAMLLIGVKLAGALESAHRLGVLHRDVKPGNILFTEYGEPALTDFGIARIAGDFQTETGTLTGSPAFTAPEVLEGQAPTPAADVYGLGATLFCALTGHAAFERRSGENVVTQFLRLTTQTAPDLRGHGFDEDVSAVVAAAMNPDPARRPSPTSLGEALQRIQRRRGFTVGDMALGAQPDHDSAHGQDTSAASTPPPDRVHGTGSLPLELTSFVDRRAELAEGKNVLASARLLTLTGIGGVGKTRLALRVASSVRKEFADGVWLVELADVSDPSLLVEVVAAAMGLRDDRMRPLSEVLVEFLCARELLLVLDNCEHLVAAIAELVESWLRVCPTLRILATSREPLNVDGEAVLRVPPLTVPDPEREPSRRKLPRYDAVTLFADRASAAVPGFQLTEDNTADVARICARLDGLPLAIELAAARMRALSPQQILQRLDDRYTLLNRASRTTPTRQQTLQLCIDWSYHLCTPAEQQLWARLSVFDGGFEIDAAELICDAAPTSHDILDILASLVDKSILVRDESNGVVRFRMLGTVRDYGRQKLRASGEELRLRREHRDWYQRLVLDAEAEWISERQPYWITRIEREQPNLREALEFTSAEDTGHAAEAGLQIVAALLMFWIFRGLYGEGRHWVDRVLHHPAAQSAHDRLKAVHAGSILAALQGDLVAAGAHADEARTLATPDAAPFDDALVCFADGLLAMDRGQLDSASADLEHAIEASDSNPRRYPHVSALSALGWVHVVAGRTERAMERYSQLLTITEACGESFHRANALWGMGVAHWQLGQRPEAIEALQQALRVNRHIRNAAVAAVSIEALAWVVDADGDAERATTLMGAADELGRRVGSLTGIAPDLRRRHDECVRRTRAALGARRFDTAFRRGRAMRMDEAVAYALGELLPDAARRSGSSAALTTREQQVAHLVAQGLTNRQIATKLVISQRTAQGHVEHILTKLGFTSRAQIAAWIAEQQAE